MVDRHAEVPGSTRIFVWSIYFSRDGVICGATLNVCVVKTKWLSMCVFIAPILLKCVLQLKPLQFCRLAVIFSYPSLSVVERSVWTDFVKRSRLPLFKVYSGPGAVSVGGLVWTT